MDTLMCQGATTRPRTAGLFILTALTVVAQTAPDAARPNWRRVGGAAIDLALAPPATGPVSRVWFSADGSRLYALTATGRVFESADLETWSPTADPAQPPALPEGRRIVDPLSTARLYPQDSRRSFALGAHLYRTSDGG